MKRQRAQALKFGALLLAAFLAGGGSALLYVFAQPVKVACFFAIPNLMGT